MITPAASLLSSFHPSEEGIHTNQLRLKNSHNFVRPYVFIKMNNQNDKVPPSQELGAEDPSPPIAPPHQYSGDQRPMSKQKEALASAYLKLSRFSALAIK